MNPTADQSTSIRVTTAPVKSRVRIACDRACSDVGLQRLEPPDAVG